MKWVKITEFFLMFPRPHRSILIMVLWWNKVYDFEVTLICTHYCCRKNIGFNPPFPAKVRRLSALHCSADPCDVTGKSVHRRSSTFCPRVSLPPKDTPMPQGLNHHNIKSIYIYSLKLKISKKLWLPQICICILESFIRYVQYLMFHKPFIVLNL